MLGDYFSLNTSPSRTLGLWEGGGGVGFGAVVVLCRYIRRLSFTQHVSIARIGGGWVVPITVPNFFFLGKITFVINIYHPKF